jgi:hypothetical protein
LDLHLKAGVYLVEIENERGKTLRKLIVEE